MASRGLDLPVVEAGTATFLKLDPAEFPHLVENESFFLDAAQRSGLRTVSSRLVHDSVGAPGLAVARFDRVTVAGTTKSLAVEDGCQALELYPSDKYAVTTERLFARLSSLCEASIPAAADFLTQVAFAYVTGNGDAHAKNFSVMQDVSGRWQPTPAYDLPTSQVYGDHTVALSIDGRSDGNLSAARFLALAATIDVPERAARNILLRISASADLWLDGIDDLPFDPARRRELTRVVRNRQQLLRGS